MAASWGCSAAGGAESEAQHRPSAAASASVTASSNSSAFNANNAAPKKARPKGGTRFIETLSVRRFLKGNIHTHTLRSDGDSEPRDVVRRYRDNGYAFLIITDHNSRTDPNELASEVRPTFALIAGEEVTMTSGGKPVHVNALCTQSTIGGGDFGTKAEALKWAIEKIHAQKAIALINHPNFDWTLNEDDLPAGVGAELIEVFSGHPYVNTDGDLLRPSHELLWTKMVDMELGYFGAAVDDMHHLKSSAKEPASRPFKGWVNVFGDTAYQDVICNGLRGGRFYSSSGVKLTHIQVTEKELAVTAAEKARVLFIGLEGAILADNEVPAGKEARYELRGGEVYVRAKVLGSDGRKAWTQPYWVK
ncbi:MAG: hypothetical protein IPK82_12445 [Polyangiaceae bacterium]|nr:hypothetical protein [Polyangiaceae bacterium]